MPAVSWFKEGLSIQNNPDYRTSFDNGSCSLTIEETFSEDSARFVCRAENEAGVAETGATLTIKGTVMEIHPPKNVFIGQGRLNSD
jgi:hypothetical protein